MNRRTAALALLILATLFLLATCTRQAPAPSYDTGCNPDRADAVVQGLAYGQGFYAGLVVSDPTNTEAIAMAERNIATNEATIARCGW
jgi:hypothetical protein